MQTTHSITGNSLFYLPNVNCDSFMSHPTISDLGYLVQWKDSQLKGRSIYKRIIGHCDEDKEEITNSSTLIYEKRSFLRESIYYIPYNYDIAIRALALSKARVFTVVFPRHCLAEDAKCFYNVREEKNKRLDERGLNCAKFLNLVCGLLGTYSGNGKGLGIGLCDCCDTDKENEALATAYKKKMKFLNSSGEAAAAEISIPVVHPVEVQRVFASRKYNIPGLHIEGDVNCNELFTIVHGHHKVLVDRYHIDIQMVYDDNNNLQAYFIRFVIIDPRIDLVRGLKRLIQRNNNVEEKRYMSRKTKNYETICEMEEIDIRDDCTLNFKQFDLYSSIQDLQELVQIYHAITGDIKYSPAKNAIYDMPAHHYYDPVIALDPARLFNTDESNEMVYKFSIKPPNDVNVWSQNDFEQYVTTVYLKQNYEVQFYNEELCDANNIDIKSFLDPNVEIPIVDVTTHANIQGYEILNCIVYLNMCIYEDPENVYRINCNNIGSIRFLSMLLPDLNPYDHQSDTQYINGDENWRHYIQPLYIHIRNNQKMLDVEQFISQTDVLNMVTSYACDFITKKYFNNEPGPKIYHNLQPGVYQNDKVEEARLKVIMRESYESLSATNYLLPEALREVMKYISDLKDPLTGETKLFIDLYNTKFKETGETGLDHYENLTPLGNFLANFNEKVLKEHLDVFQNFHLYMPSIMFMVNRTHLQFGMQPCGVIKGEKATGKSNVSKNCKNLLLPGTIIKVESSSKESFSSKGQKAPGCYYSDEGDESNNALYTRCIPKYLNLEQRFITLFNNINKKDTMTNVSVETLKTALTEGRNVREKPIRSNNNQKTILFEYKMRVSYLNLTNWDIYNILDAMKSRVYWMLAYRNPLAQKSIGDVEIFDEESDIESLSGMEMDEEESETEHLIGNMNDSTTSYPKMMQSFQCFYETVNYLIACGAITFGKEEMMIAKVLIHRFKSVLSTLFPFEFDYTPRWEDIFQFFLRFFSIMNVWVNICSGCYKGLKHLQPDSCYSIDLFRCIQQYRLLCPTEEVVITCLSYMDHYFPPLEITAYAHWLLTKVVEKGIKMDGQFKNVDVELFRPKETSSNNRNRSNVVAVDSDSGNQNTSIPGIVSTFTLPPIDASRFGNLSQIQEMNSDVNKLYDANYVDLVWGNSRSLFTNVSYAEEEFAAFAAKHYNVEKIGALDTFHMFLHETITCKELKFASNNDDGNIPENGNNTTYSINADNAKQEYKLMYFKKSATDNKIIVSVCFAWVYKMFVDGSYLRNLNSSTDFQFAGSALENALQHMSYKGCSKFDILIPGMTLTHSAQNFVKSVDMSNIMKKIKYGEGFIDSLDYEREDPLLYFPKLTIPKPKNASDEPVIFTFDYETSKDDFGEVAYFNELWNYLKNGFYNCDENHFEEINIKKKDGKKLLNEISMKIFENCSAKNVRNAFKASIENYHRQSKGVYPESIIEKIRAKNSTTTEHMVSFPSIGKLSSSILDQEPISRFSGMTMDDEDGPGDEELRAMSKNKRRKRS